METQAQSIERVLATLGERWNLGRPAKPLELGRALRLNPRDPARPVLDWLQERRSPREPALVAIKMMMNGALPPDGLSSIVVAPRVKKRRVRK